VNKLGVGSGGLSPVNDKRACETESDIPEQHEDIVVPDLSSLDLVGPAAALSGAGLNERSCHEHQPGQMQL
jgi:hypothetical protein